MRSKRVPGPAVEEGAAHQGAHPLAVARVDASQVALERAFELARADAEDLAELVGPRQPAAVGVPAPGADVRERLRPGHLVAARAQLGRLRAHRLLESALRAAEDAQRLRPPPRQRAQRQRDQRARGDEGLQEKQRLVDRGAREWPQALDRAPDRESARQKHAQRDDAVAETTRRPREEGDGEELRGAQPRRRAPARTRQAESRRTGRRTAPPRPGLPRTRRARRDAPRRARRARPRGSRWYRPATRCTSWRGTARPEPRRCAKSAETPAVAATTLARRCARGKQESCLGLPEHCIAVEEAARQPGSAQRLERVAGRDAERGGNREIYRVVRQGGAEPDARPPAHAPEEQNREGDTGRGPHRGGVARRNREHKRSFGRREIGEGQDGHSRQVGEPDGIQGDGVHVRSSPLHPPNRYGPIGAPAAP